MNQNIIGLVNPSENVFDTISVMNYYFKLQHFFYSPFFAIIKYIQFKHPIVIKNNNGLKYLANNPNDIVN